MTGAWPESVVIRVDLVIYIRSGELGARVREFCSHAHVPICRIFIRSFPHEPSIHFPISGSHLPSARNLNLQLIQPYRAILQA